MCLNTMTSGQYECWTLWTHGPWMLVKMIALHHVWTRWMLARWLLCTMSEQHDDCSAPCLNKMIALRNVWTRWLLVNMSDLQYVWTRWMLARCMLAIWMLARWSHMEMIAVQVWSQCEMNIVQVAHAYIHTQYHIMYTTTYACTHKTCTRHAHTSNHIWQGVFFHTHPRIWSKSAASLMS